MSAFKTGEIRSIDCIHVNFLVVTMYCILAGCSHWWKWGEEYPTSLGICVFQQFY